MNFYASPGFLETVAEVHFSGQPAAVEDIRIGDEVLRLLVVGGKRVVTSPEFLDYHQPRPASASAPAARRLGYANSVVRAVIDASDWECHRARGIEPAPFVDWSRFGSFDDYIRFLHSKSKRLFKDQERRRRRLAEALGPLEFCADDRSADVFEFATRFKGQQLHETGARNYLADPKNVEFLRVLHGRGLILSSTLRAGRRLMAVWIGFIHEGVWSGWIFTYDHDPDLRRYSLGHQLLHAMLEESYRRGHREFDFSIGDEDYKWLYSTHARVLGPVGTAPLRQRALVGAKDRVKRVLALSPAILEALSALKRQARRQRAGLTAWLGQVAGEARGGGR